MVSDLGLHPSNPAGHQPSRLNDRLTCAVVEIPFALSLETRTIVQELMQRMFTPPWSDPASVRVIFFAVYSFPLDVDLYGVLMVAGCSFGTELSAVRAPLYMHIAGFILLAKTPTGYYVVF